MDGAAVQGQAARPGPPESEFPCPSPLPRRRVQVMGRVFFDLVYSGLTEEPQPGTEVQAAHLGIAPGGVANIAVALARLGLDVGLSALFAEDAFGDYLWSLLDYEGIDLSFSARVPDWTTPVTTSVAYGPERTMVTYEHPAPFDVATLLPPRYRADAFVLSLADVEAGWLAALHTAGPMVFADVGWDLEQLGSHDLVQKLAHVDVFMPNSAEARQWTGQADVDGAARALAGGQRLVVIKDSGSGSVALGPAMPAPLRVPGLRVPVRDTTGAGDVFDAGFIYGTLAGWPLAQRLRFANLCGAESVKLEGGSLAAPCWRDLKAFWDALEDERLREDYRFLPHLFDSQSSRHPCTRACPTLSALPAAGTGPWPAVAGSDGVAAADLPSGPADQGPQHGAAASARVSSARRSTLS